jgi:hypothetical protein
MPVDIICCQNIVATLGTSIIDGKQPVLWQSSWQLGSVVCQWQLRCTSFGLQPNLCPQTATTAMLIALHAACCYVDAMAGWVILAAVASSIILMVHTCGMLQLRGAVLL